MRAFTLALCVSATVGLQLQAEPWKYHDRTCVGRETLGICVFGYFDNEWANLPNGKDQWTRLGYTAARWDADAETGEMCKAWAENFTWACLPPARKEDARDLGYTEEAWDGNLKCSYTGERNINGCPTAFGDVNLL